MATTASTSHRFHVCVRRHPAGLLPPLLGQPEDTVDAELHGSVRTEDTRTWTWTRVRTWTWTRTFWERLRWCRCWCPVVPRVCGTPWSPLESWSSGPGRASTPSCPEGDLRQEAPPEGAKPRGAVGPPAGRFLHRLTAVGGPGGQTVPSGASAGRGAVGMTTAPPPPTNHRAACGRLLAEVRHASGLLPAQTNAREGQRSSLPPRRRPFESGRVRGHTSVAQTL